MHVIYLYVIYLFYVGGKFEKDIQLLLENLKKKVLFLNLKKKKKRKKKKKKNSINLKSKLSMRATCRRISVEIMLLICMVISVNPTIRCSNIDDIKQLYHDRIASDGKLLKLHNNFAK